MTGRAIGPETYATWRATTLGRITERVETKVVFDLAGPLATKRVLDVGTGDGTYAIGSARRGALVTGLDVDQEMLDAASRRGTSSGVDLRLVLGRVESLPFEDGAFDVVFAVTVLCFVPEADRAVREMARVLVPGGRIVLGELASFSLWAAERRLRGWLGSGTWRRANFWSRGELAALAVGAGLQVEDARGCVFFPRSSLMARIAAPLEPVLSRFHVPGGAFLALAAEKREWLD